MQLATANIRGFTMCGAAMIKKDIVGNKPWLSEGNA
jgi:hypothetical protein